MRRNNIYFLLALICALTAVNTKSIPLGIIMYVGFAYFIIKLIIADNAEFEKIRKKYEDTQHCLSNLYEYLEENRLMTAEEIEKITQLPEDKPRGTVRPGSKPSITYEHMRLIKEGNTADDAEERSDERSLL